MVTRPSDGGNASSQDPLPSYDVATQSTPNPFADPPNPFADPADTNVAQPATTAASRPRAAAMHQLLDQAEAQQQTQPRRTQPRQARLPTLPRRRIGFSSVFAFNTSSIIALAILAMLIILSVALLQSAPLQPVETYDCSSLIEGHSPTRYTCNTWTWFFIFLFATGLGGIMQFFVQHAIVNNDTLSGKLRGFGVVMGPILAITFAWAFFGGLAASHGCLRGCA
ncbi:hypothetical protein PRZ48_005057 [Zasmidium cellare]|uniref:Uncharacterized protein n=1 Tax=Zasmidium cellare TaxID=395010 RepID=A0ABR0ESP3_ZASCE|nr:hypothetical protein PRZ48_005057 [Zasmidium cellare]